MDGSVFRSVTGQRSSTSFTECEQKRLRTNDGGTFCRTCGSFTQYIAVQLNSEEENALRYVSGYVALKLMRQYEKKEDEKATQFVECLSNMAVVGVESNFYEYTKEWIAAIYRGGLFHINDSAYHLFRAIEEKQDRYFHVI